MRQACVKRGEGRCKIAGMGSAGLDYLAVVSAFPQPDQKIRTESFEVCAMGCDLDHVGHRFKVEAIVGMP